MSALIFFVAIASGAVSQAPPPHPISGKGRAVEQTGIIRVALAVEPPGSEPVVDITLDTVKLPALPALRAKAVRRMQALCVGTDLTLIIDHWDSRTGAGFGEVLYAPKHWKPSTHLQYLDYDLVALGLAAVNSKHLPSGKPAADELLGAQRKAKKLHLGIWAR